MMSRLKLDSDLFLFAEHLYERLILCVWDEWGCYFNEDNTISRVFLSVRLECLLVHVLFHRKRIQMTPLINKNAILVGYVPTAAVATTRCQYWGQPTMESVQAPWST